jgi:hypothetical protein
MTDVRPSSEEQLKPSCLAGSATTCGTVVTIVGPSKRAPAAGSEVIVSVRPEMGVSTSLSTAATLSVLLPLPIVTLNMALFGTWGTSLTGAMSKLTTPGSD